MYRGAELPTALQSSEKSSTPRPLNPEPRVRRSQDWLLMRQRVAMEVRVVKNTVGRNCEPVS